MIDAEEGERTAPPGGDDRLAERGCIEGAQTPALAVGEGEVTVAAAVECSHSRVGPPFGGKDDFGRIRHLSERLQQMPPGEALRRVEQRGGTVEGGLHAGVCLDHQY